MPRRVPLYIGVYDKNFVRRGVIGMPKFVTVTPRYNQAGTATIGILATDRMVEKCVADGARIVIEDENEQHLLSGPVVRFRGSGPTKTSLIEVDVIDDFALLSYVLGWVQPAQPIDSQGIAGSNWEMTGTAEAVLKAAVQANAVNRLGLPLTIEPDLGRGASVTAKLRFHPLYDRLFPRQDGAGIEDAGVGFRIRQIEGGLYLEAYEPNVHPRDLTEESGVITEWSYSSARPTATRVIIGGQGEAQLRVFRFVIDAEREALIGTKLERFRDARDTNDNLLLYARGNETLADGAQKNGLSITLSQTANFRYGVVKVGDTVNIRVGPHIVITDRLNEATLSWTQGDGWKSTPRVGDRSDDPDRSTFNAIRAIARYVTNQNRT